MSWAPRLPAAPVGDAMCWPVVPITNLAWGRPQSFSNATQDGLPSAIAKSSIQRFRADSCTTRLRYRENHFAYSAQSDPTLIPVLQRLETPKLFSPGIPVRVAQEVVVVLVVAVVVLVVVVVVVVVAVVMVVVVSSRNGNSSSK